MFNRLIIRLGLMKDQRIRLTIPRGALFAFLSVMLLILFILVSLSTYYLCLVTAPLLAYWCYCFYWFDTVWRGFGYSGVILVVIGLTAVILGIVVGKPLASHVWSLIKTLF